MTDRNEDLPEGSTGPEGEPHSRDESSRGRSDREEDSRDGSRKRGGGEGRRDWDSIVPPEEEHFDSEENYLEALAQWRRLVRRRLEIEPTDWPIYMNVSDTAEMVEETLGFSRSTFYRRIRGLFDYYAQTVVGKKTARREEVIRTILSLQRIEREDEAPSRLFNTP